MPGRILLCQGLLLSELFLIFKTFPKFRKCHVAFHPNWSSLSTIQGLCLLVAILDDICLTVDRFIFLAVLESIDNSITL